MKFKSLILAAGFVLCLTSCVDENEQKLLEVISNKESGTKIDINSDNYNLYLQVDVSYNTQVEKNTSLIT